MALHKGNCKWDFCVISDNLPAKATKAEIFLAQELTDKHGFGDLPKATTLKVAHPSCMDSMENREQNLCRADYICK